MAWERTVASVIQFKELKVKEAKVNTFDIAHLADFIQVAEYIGRFELAPDKKQLVVEFVQSPLPAATPGASHNAQELDGSSNDGEQPSGGEKQPTEDGSQQADIREMRRGGSIDGSAPSPTDQLRNAIIEHLTDAINRATEGTDEGVRNTGEVQFDDRAESAHYFATLHALRALHALHAPLPCKVPRIVDGARAFAVEQCFFYQRGATHRQDALRLAFACSIYAIYGEHVDQDLCLAIIEALHQAQQENGSWPAAHPILRLNDRPWHIASHESRCA